MLALARSSAHHGDSKAMKIVFDYLFKRDQLYFLGLYVNIERKECCEDFQYIYVRENS